MDNPINTPLKIRVSQWLLVRVVFHLQKEREKVIVSSLPKPTLWSTNIVIRVIRLKILGIWDLLGYKAITHRMRTGYMHWNCTGDTQTMCTEIAWYVNVGNSIDSFPIGVSADSCPLNGPWQWCHLIRVQLVSFDCGPQKGVINKIYNLLHHVLG